MLQRGHCHHVQHRGQRLQQGRFQHESAFGPVTIFVLIVCCPNPGILIQQKPALTKSSLGSQGIPCLLGLRGGFATSALNSVDFKLPKGYIASGALPEKGNLSLRLHADISNVPL